MPRPAKPIYLERKPLAVGTPLKNGAWAIAELVGVGGRHLQYKAMGRALRKSAVKEYFPPDWERAENGLRPLHDEPKQLALRDFFREALELARDLPSHCVLMTTYDIFEESGTTYAAYEWNDGLNLSEILKRRGSLAPEIALPIIMQIGSGLDHLHKLGFLHRDINPFNVMVETSGKAKVGDFETLSPYPKTRSFPGMTIVNPDYAPLELLSTFPSNGPESDVYGLAALTYHLLTGRRPIPAASRVASPSLAPAHAIKVSIPPILSAALDRALRVRAKERTPTIGDFLGDLTGSQS